MGTMIKTFAFISAILVSICPAYEGLVCYNCYSLNSKHGLFDYKLNRCNEENLAASETIVCPSEKSKCIYEIVESEYIKGPQIWRTCSDPNFEPCDPKAVPNGLKMLKCTYCGTDKCNLHENKTEQNSFTININANISLSIE